MEKAHLPGVPPLPSRRSVDCSVDPRALSHSHLCGSIRKIRLITNARMRLTHLRRYSPVYFTRHSRRRNYGRAKNSRPVSFTRDAHSHRPAENSSKRRGASFRCSRERASDAGREHRAFPRHGTPGRSSDPHNERARDAYKTTRNATRSDFVRRCATTRSHPRPAANNSKKY